MKVLFKIVFLILFTLVSSITWAQTQIVYVNQAVDASGDGKTWETAKKTIQEAIDVADDGAEIWIAKGEYNLFTADGTQKLQKSLKLIGGWDSGEEIINDRTIEKNKTLLFSSTNEVFTAGFSIIKDSLKIEFDGFFITDLGPLVYGDYWSNLSFTDLKIKKCRIYNLSSILSDTKGKLSVDSSVFSNNTGGNIVGGNYEQIELTNSKWVNCKEGVCVTNQVEEINIDNCIFDSVPKYITNGGGNLNVTNTKINGKYSSGYLFSGIYDNVSLKLLKIENYNGYVFAGGANNQIILERDTLTNVKSSSLFYIDYGPDFKIEKSSFNNCSGGVDGKFNNIEINNTEFKNDSALYFSGSIEEIATVNKCLFEDVRDSLNSMFSFDGEGDFIFSNSKVDNFHGNGRFFQLGNKVTIENSEIVNSDFYNFFVNGVDNRIKNFQFLNCEFRNNRINNFIHLTAESGAHFKINNVKLLNNDFYYTVPIFGFTNFSGDNAFQKVDIINSDIKYALLSLQNSGNLTIKNVNAFETKFYNFLSFKFSNKNIFIDNLKFEDVEFINGGFDLNNGDIDCKQLSCKNINLNSFPFISSVDSISLFDSKFDSVDVGAVSLFSTDSKYNIRNTSFKNFYTVEGAQNPSVAALNGDGIIEDCQFIGINGGNYGGALGVTGNLTIKNSLFDKIKGGNGGVINASSGQIKIYNCDFNSNIARQGGCIHSIGKIFVNNSRFMNNSSLEIGGVFYRSTFGDIFVANSIFSNNSSINDGVYYGQNGEFLNCLFIHNSAEKGAITSDAFGYYSNCTFYDNNSLDEFLFKAITAGGGGPIVSANSFINSIFWKNSPTETYGNISHSNIQGGFPGTGNLDLDPKFVDPENGDFRLSCESPLINKGSNLYAPNSPDAYGTPRIMGDTVDMGAFEFPGDPLVAKKLPEPDFLFSNDNPCINELVDLKNNTLDIDNFTYKWNTGDSSNFISARDTSHSYKVPGSYPVEIVATNACGTSVSITKNIDVKESFIPSINYKTTVCHGDTISFTTNATCQDLVWEVIGGTIMEGNGTSEIIVQWGDGLSGNGKVRLSASNCGNEAVCEFPVEVEIPIMPEAKPLIGDTLVCQGASTSYHAINRDFIPGAIYNWSVKGGNLSGPTSGYGLDSVSVTWSSTDTVGILYLNIINELVECSTLDSFVVKLRPTYHITDTDTDFCLGSEFAFGTNLPGNFQWSISGNGNQIDLPSGEAFFGSNTGTFVVSNFTIDSTAFCNWSDSININLHDFPVIDSVTGENEVRDGVLYPYEVFYSGDESYIRWLPYKSNYSMNGSPANVNWRFGEPFGFDVFVESNIAGCKSDTISFPVKPDFVYTISGPDTLCVDVTQDFYINSDSENGEVVSWKLNGTSLSGGDTLISIEFLDPGYNSLQAEITRKGKLYAASKRIFVNAAAGRIFIKGPPVLSPSGGGTFDYTIENKNSLDLDISVTGSESFSISDSILTVTWNSEGPYQILINGTKAGETCPAIPVILNVSKAPVLSDEITLESGSICPNTLTTFSIETDSYTKEIQWQLDGGGTILSSNDGNVTVEWGEDISTFTLSATYTRFGTQLLSKSIKINAPPTPQISGEIICGEDPLTLTTLTSYQSYQWTQEPSGEFVSNLAQIQTETPGIYSVVVTDLNGCSGQVSKNILAVPYPLAKISSEERVNTCLGTGSRTLNVSTIEGSDYTYEWKLDGSDAGTNEPVFSFNQNIESPGYVTVSLKVTSSDVCTAEDSQVFRVYTPEECETNNGNGGNGNTCEEEVSFEVSGYQPFVFTNTSSQIDGFKWDFGDETKSELRSGINHTYEEIGVYDVSLSYGCRKVTKRVKVPVIARFAAPEIICQNAEVEFKDFSVNLPESPIISYSWDFGDGESSFLQHPPHVFSDSGKFEVTLTVKAFSENGTEISHSFSKNIDVSPAPVVDFSISDQACNSNLLEFENLSTFKTSAAIYNWDLGNGQKSGWKDPSARYPVGSFDVNLTVTDYIGCSASLLKPVNVLPPVSVKPISVNGELSICQNDSIELVSPPSSDIYTWKKDGIIIPLNTRSIFAKESGSYSVEYSEASCTLNTTPVEVEVFELKTSEISFNAPTCINESLEISVSGINVSKHSILWRQDTLALPYSGASFTIGELSSNDAGIYSAIIKDKVTSCEYTVPGKELVVHNKPAQPRLFSSKSSVCYDDSVLVKYSNPIANPYSLKWRIGINELSLYTADSLYINPAYGNSNVKLTVTDQATGCVSSSNDYPVAFGKYIKPELGADIDACERTYQSISSNVKSEEYDFDWYRGDTLLTNSLSRMDFASLQKTDAGLYYTVVTSKAVNGNVAGCEFISDTAYVTVKTAPLKPKITGDTVYCEGSLAILRSSISENIEWSTGAIIDSIKVFEPGPYQVKVTDPTSGCQTKASVSVVENPLPDFSFLGTGVYEFCASDRLEFEGLDEYESFQWKLDGEDFGKPNTNIYPRRSGKYTVTATTDKGCSAESDTLRLTSLPCACLVISEDDGPDFGSLRYAIGCANEKSGLDYILFDIEGDGPRTIRIDSALPKIKETVIIDGFSQSGEGIFDIVIKGNQYKAHAFVQENSIEVSEFRGLQFEDFDNAIYLDFGNDGSIIENNRFKGGNESAVELSGLINEASVRNNTFQGNGKGEAINLSYVTESEIKDNTISNFETGILLETSYQNELAGNTMDSIYGNGMMLSRSSFANTISGNTLTNIDSSAIVVLSSDTNTFVANLIGEDREGVAGPIGKNGIQLSGSEYTDISSNTIRNLGNDGIRAGSRTTIKNNRISYAGKYGVFALDSSVIYRNTFWGHGQAAIYVDSNEVRVSQNGITNANSTKKGIDLAGKGNFNKDFADFTTYEFLNNSLKISGTSLAGDTIEIFRSSDRPQQANRYSATTIADQNGDWSVILSNGINYNPDSKNYYINTASAGNNTSELSGPFLTGCATCICLVTNTDDSGTGSLRAAVDSAHAGVCRTIEFGIEPSTISLLNPIRDIEVQLNVKGKQGIVLEGPGSGNGFQVNAKDFTLTDLSFTKWDTAINLSSTNGNISDVSIDQTKLPVKISGDQNQINATCINCSYDNSGFAINTGIEVSGNENSIFSNNIVGASETGINVNGGLKNTILNTTVSESQKGITHVNDGNSNYPAPFELEGLIDDNNQGVISGKAKPGDKIQVFLSDYTGRPAKEFVVEITSSIGEFSIPIPAEFTPANQNAFFILTATSPDGSTSEFSEVVRIGDNTVYCTVINTDNEGEGSLRAAVDCVNEAGKGTGANAVIVFDLNTQTENIIEVLDSGFVITNNYGVLVDPGDIPVRVKSQADKLPYAFSWQVNNIEMRKLAFEGFGKGISLQNGVSNRIVGNTFYNNDTAVYISNSGRNTVSDNNFKSGGLGFFGQSADVELVSNTFGGDNNVLYKGALLVHADKSSVTYNYFTNILGDVFLESDKNGAGLIVENTSEIVVSNNRSSCKDSSYNAFIFIKCDSSFVSRNEFNTGATGILLKNSNHMLLAKNTFKEIGQYGISLDSSRFIDITENSSSGLKDSSKIININYAKSNESNEGLKVPVFTYATYRDGKVIYRGKAEEESKVEIFESSLNGNDLISFRDSVVADRFGNFEYAIAVSPANVNDYTLRATSTFSRYYFEDWRFSYTSEASEAFNPNLEICYVTKEGDNNVEGTLRYNINLANEDKCNLMLFNVAGKDSVNIGPQIKLPTITATNLTIDATSQPGYIDRPAVNIWDNGTFVRGFDVNTDGDIAIHGIRMLGFASPILVREAGYFESSYSEFGGFRAEGISILSSGHRNIRLDHNDYLSDQVDYIWNFTKSNILADSNRLVGGKISSVLLQGDSVALIKNIFHSGGLTEGYAMVANKVDSLYARDNKIGGFSNGAVLRLVNDLYFIGNDFSALVGEDSLHFGLELIRCPEGKVLGNIFSKTDTSIVVSRSENISLEGNYIDLSKAGITVDTSASAFISSNTISSTPLGILVSGSDSVSLHANTIYQQDSLGIRVDSLSENLIITGNLIGASSLFSRETSYGAGMLIKSSNNTIGGADSLGNKLIRNENGGVLIQRGTGNKITYNTFLNNDTTDTKPGHFAIWHLDSGNVNKTAPEITSIEEVEKNWKYWVYGTSEPFDTIHLYRSEGYYQNANGFAGKGMADASGKWSILVDTTIFEVPHILNTLTIVATATDEFNNTSQFSEIAYLGTCYITSVFDNIDNEYPVPNSFRQAVRCANDQPTKAEIRFFLDGGNGYKIYMEREMITLDNDSGVSFNGKNMRYQDLISGMPSGKDTAYIQSGYNIEAVDTTVFWRISAASGNSEFDNLKVDYFDTAFVFKSPENIRVSNMKFESIPLYSIVLEDSSKNYNLFNLELNGSVNGGLVKVQSGSHNILIDSCTITTALKGVDIINSSRVTLLENNFNYLYRAVRAENVDSLIAISNTFNSGLLSILGIRAIGSSGVLDSNTFDNYLEGIPVHISRSDSFKLNQNSFKRFSKTGVLLEDVLISSLTSNKFDTVGNVGVKMVNCDSILVSENSIAKIGKLAYNLENSQRIRMTKNTILSKTENELPLINIHKNVNGELSNLSKEEPVIEGYEVKKGDDCSKLEDRLGIYLYGKADSLDVIEIFASDTSGTVFKEFIVDGVADSLGNWSIRIPREKYERDTAYVYSFSATATGLVHNTSQESQTYNFDNMVNKLVVKNTADYGDGSLRNAVYDINCSDIHSVVYYQIDEIAPYEIKLDSTLPAIYAYLGFTMDGKTQREYHDSLEIEADPGIYIDGSSFEDSLALFVLVDSTDSSSVARLNIVNTPNAFRLINDGNRLDSLTIYSDLVRSDTAIKASGHYNKISYSEISGYRRGVYLIGNSNHVEKSTIKNTNTAVELYGDVSGNKVSENKLESDSVLVSIYGANGTNFISENEFGSLEKPVSINGVRLYSSSNQYILDNVMTYGEAAPDDSMAAFILVSDSSHHNFISENRIGMDTSAQVILKANMPAVIIAGDTAKEILLGNSLNKNEVAGLTVPAILIKFANTGTISNNYLGVDSAYVQRDFLPHFETVAGIDTTAIIVENSKRLTITDNDIVNFRNYGVDVRNSDGIQLIKNKIYSEFSDLKAIQLNLGTDYYSNDSVMAPVIDTNAVLDIETITISGRTQYPLADVLVYQSFTPNDKDTVSHSLRYVNSVISDANGNWTVEVPSENFGFNKLNKYVAQVSKGLNASEYSEQFTVKSLLCLLVESGYDLLDTLYQPCPGSQFTIDAQLENLDYYWTSMVFDTLKTKEVQIDESAFVTLTLKDDFGCEMVEDFEVRYKPRPEEPKFIVTTQPYVSDTIVLIDISPVELDEYDWSSSDGLAIVSTSDSTSFTGPDGKKYPYGREVRFIAPDTGEYTITQRSLRDGCFVKLDKTIEVDYKDPNVKNPYTSDPGQNSLYVYPSPYTNDEGSNAFFTTTGEGEVEIQIVDALGLIHHYDIVSGSKSYNVPLGPLDLPTGVYILKMNTGTAQLTYKFMVE